MTAATKWAIENAQKKYSPSALNKADCAIRRMSGEEYKSWPLVLGKATRIQDDLKKHYGFDLSVYYIWEILKEMEDESNE